MTVILWFVGKRERDAAGQEKAERGDGWLHMKHREQLPSHSVCHLLRLHGTTIYIITIIMAFYYSFIWHLATVCTEQEWRAENSWKVKLGPRCECEPERSPAARVAMLLNKALAFLPLKMDAFYVVLKQGRFACRAPLSYKAIHTVHNDRGTWAKQNI